jgi:S-adenosylmethionine hydrolase
MERIIGLVTDFGPRGQHYIAAMKAIIMKTNPNVKILDISHNVAAYSVLEASYILQSTYNYFPERSIFIAVIDPGVGSGREIIALKTKSNFYFIGPNNGIFPNFLTESEISECISIQNKEYFNHPVSATFHGRDIMAPVAAYIAEYKDFPLSDLGSNYNFSNLKRISMIYNISSDKKSITCPIQYIDSFGNGITPIRIVNNKINDLDISLEHGMKIKLIIKNDKYRGIFTNHFSGAPIDSLLLLVGSTGLLEISINQGNASTKLGFKSGDIITVRI